MNRSRRLSGYLLIGLVSVRRDADGSRRARATSNQTQPGQGISVPTRPQYGNGRRHHQLPPPTDPPTDRPTDRPSVGNGYPLPPVATPTAPACHPPPPPCPPPLALAPSAGPGEGGRPAGSVAGRHRLVHADREQSGRACPARQVMLRMCCRRSLDPGAVEGTSAAWDGRTLRGRWPLLPPGGKWVVIFSASVREDAAAGGLLVNSAQATGCRGSERPRRRVPGPAACRTAGGRRRCERSPAAVSGMRPQRTANPRTRPVWPAPLAGLIALILYARGRWRRA